LSIKDVAEDDLPADPEDADSGPDGDSTK
jgi:hypothetical protein